MLDSIYHMTLKYFEIEVFGLNTLRFCPLYLTLLRQPYGRCYIMLPNMKITSSF